MADALLVTVPIERSGSLQRLRVVQRTMAPAVMFLEGYFLDVTNNN